MQRLPLTFIDAMQMQNKFDTHLKEPVQRGFIYKHSTCQVGQVRKKIILALCRSGTCQKCQVEKSAHIPRKRMLTQDLSLTKLIVTFRL